MSHRPRIAVLSESVWRDHLGSAPDVVGSTVRLNGIPTTVIGVIRDGFEDPADAELWMLAPREVPTSPVPIEGDPEADREVNYFSAVGRLRSDVTAEQANADDQYQRALLAFWTAKADFEQAIGEDVIP